MDVIKAEAVAVWKGCIDSKQALISTGQLQYIANNSSNHYIHERMK